MIEFATEFVFLDLGIVRKSSSGEWFAWRYDRQNFEAGPCVILRDDETNVVKKYDSAQQAHDDLYDLRSKEASRP